MIYNNIKITKIKNIELKISILNHIRNHNQFVDYGFVRDNTILLKNNSNSLWAIGVLSNNQHVCTYYYSNISDYQNDLHILGFF